ncbi:MAG: hypothetical protein UI647_07575 [Negativibacillus sp.]
MVEHHTAQLAVAGKLRFGSCGGSAVKKDFSIQIGIFPGNILRDVLVKDPLCRSVQRSAVGGDSQRKLTGNRSLLQKLLDRLLRGLQGAVKALPVKLVVCHQMDAIERLHRLGVQLILLWIQGDRQRNRLWLGGKQLLELDKQEGKALPFLFLRKFPVDVDAVQRVLPAQLQDVLAECLPLLLGGNAAAGAALPHQRAFGVYRCPQLGLLGQQRSSL